MKNKNLLEQGEKTFATIKEVKRCWWLKVNTKPVRKHTLDGAKFPHKIVYIYEVEGETYIGKQYLSWSIDPPAVNSKITVYYQKDNPKKCTADL